MLLPCTALKTPFFETVGYTVTVWFFLMTQSPKGLVTDGLMNSDTSLIIDNVHLPRPIKMALYRIFDNVNLC